MDCTALFTAAARQGDATASTSGLVRTVAASIATGLGVAAVTTGVYLVNSKRARSSWRSGLGSSFSSSCSSGRSSCPALTSADHRGSTDSTRSLLQRCSGDWSEAETASLRTEKSEDASFREVSLPRKEDESCLSEPTTPGFTVGTPDCAEVRPARCTRRISLDDRRVGMLSEAGVLERVEGYPEDWLPWQLAPEAIEFCKGPNGEAISLGRGAFGQVFLARMNRVIPVAVKAMKADLLSAVREVALLRALANTNIVQFQGACMRGEELLLVTEFMEGGDLLKAIRKKAIQWHHRGGQIAMDVARGLHYLHSNRVVHLDLKSPNILLSRHGVAKIGDVGLARIRAQGAKSLDHAELMSEHSSCGTFAWAAPELLMSGQQPCCEKADIFSFGVVLWEIVTGEAPVRGRMRDVRCPEDCPQEIANLIDACMAFDPQARPSAIEAFETLRRVVRCEQRNSTRTVERGTKSIDVPRSNPGRIPASLRQSLQLPGSAAAAKAGGEGPAINCLSGAQYHQGRAAAARAAFGLQNVEEGDEQLTATTAAVVPCQRRLTHESGSFGREAASSMKRVGSCPLLCRSFEAEEEDVSGGAAT